MKLLQAMLAAGLVTGMVSCATQSPPQGGPKDETPPKLLKSTPEDQQLNVDTRTIILEFDEEVQQNNLSKELLITPNVNNPYKVLSNKTQMTLQFEKPLQDSTTYTLNFREGITDITEKNKAKGLRLSFSTGSFIDSSRVAGKVIDLMKQTPEKEAVVVLYQAEDTLTIRKHRPYYLTSTDAQGNFDLQNVKEGNYLMYAVVDKNNNSYYDSEEERIAYLGKPITITPTTDTVTLQTVRIDTKKPILLSRGKFTDRFVAGYNEGVQQFVAKPVAGNDTLVSKSLPDGKTIEVFKTSTFGGGKAILAAVDSAGNITSDTLDLAFEGKPSTRIKGAALKVINGAQNGYRVGQEVVVELQTPVKIAGKAPVTLMADSIKVADLQYPDQLKLDRTNTELSFNIPSINNTIRQLTVVLDSTAILPIEGQPLALPPLQVSIAEGKGATGSFSGNIRTKYESYTLQLLDTKYKVVAEQPRANKKYSFRNIAPGTYYLRVLIDENKNGKWDGPDPKLERQSEPVYLYPSTVEVRANWELEDIHLEF